MGKIKEWPLFITLALGFLSPIKPSLLTISNISIALTSIFQILTTVSYINANNEEVKKLKKEQRCHSINEITNEENKNKEELIITKQNNKTKLEQYKNLRNVLNEILNVKTQNDNNIELEGYQKTKEL